MGEGFLGTRVHAAENASRNMCIPQGVTDGGGVLRDQGSCC